MSGNSFVLDTNIVLYLLSGNSTVADIVDGSQTYVSFVTQLELLGYKGISNKEQQKVKAFLADCIIVDITEKLRRTLSRSNRNIISNYRIASSQQQPNS